MYVQGQCKSHNKSIFHKHFFKKLFKVLCNEFLKYKYSM